MSNNAPHQSSPIPCTHFHMMELPDQPVALLTESFVLCALLLDARRRRCAFPVRLFLLQAEEKEKEEEEEDSSLLPPFFRTMINRSICRIAALNVEAAASCLSDQRQGIICSIFSSSGMEWRKKTDKSGKAKEEGESNARKGPYIGNNDPSSFRFTPLIPASHSSVSILLHNGFFRGF